ncbi:MAG: septum formation initiator family protein [Firmicutes bacterium]|nr:septum formation initiator family protein [Bacillota bacterium]
MAQTNIFRKIHLVYKPSSLLTKAVIVAAIVLSMGTMALLSSAQQDAQAQAEALRLQAARLEQENALLEERIAQLGTIDSVAVIAGEELGLVKPGTVIIRPEA